MKQIDSNTLFFGNFVDADLKFADLHDYLYDIDNFIRRKKRYKEKKLGKGVVQDIALEMFSESFSSILFDSVLISVWVFMEAEFKGYCGAMQHAMGVSLNYSDLRGSTIERFKNYTSKVLKLDLMLRDENWEDLKAINEIRNSLVHTDGIVGNKKLVNNFIKHHKLAGLLYENKISIDKNILIIIITLCRLFIERIYCVALEKFPGQYGSKS
jgi:hypothetical protein